MWDLSIQSQLWLDNVLPTQKPTWSEWVIGDKLRRALELIQPSESSKVPFHSSVCDATIVFQEKVIRSLWMDLRFTSKLDRDFLLDFHFQEPELFCKIFQNFRYTQDGLEICIWNHSPIVLKRGQWEIDVVYFEKIATIDAMSELPYSSDELLILQSLLIALKRFYLPLKENI